MNDARKRDRCQRCGSWFRDGELRTRLYVAEDPSGEQGLSGVFHDECALPVWNFAVPDTAAIPLQ